MLEFITDNLPGKKWVSVEIWNLRAGGMIRVVYDKVQRRTDKDGSQHYYLKKEKETLEPQEFESIYVGSKGEEILKMFSPTKGVYLPIKFMFNKLRELTIEEQEKLDSLQSKEEKTKYLKKLYGDMYEAYFESKMDADTLNHAVYKIQKNALRLQGGGMDLATKITLLIVFMIVASVISAWLQYNYFIKPGMEFWDANSGDVLKARELTNEQLRLETGYYDKYEPEKVPVTPEPVK